MLTLIKLFAAFNCGIAVGITTMCLLQVSRE
jgi:hypothetical protein